MLCAAHREQGRNVMACNFFKSNDARGDKGQTVWHYNQGETLRWRQELRDVT